MCICWVGCVTDLHIHFLANVHPIASQVMFPKLEVFNDWGALCSSYTHSSWNEVSRLQEECKCRVVACWLWTS